MASALAGVARPHARDAPRNHMSRETSDSPTLAESRKALRRAERALASGENDSALEYLEAILSDRVDLVQVRSRLELAALRVRSGNLAARVKLLTRAAERAEQLNPLRGGRPTPRTSGEMTRHPHGLSRFHSGSWARGGILGSAREPTRRPEVSMRRRILSLGLYGILGLLAACGGGGGGEPSPLPLRLSIPSAWPHEAWLPSFQSPFMEALEAYSAAEQRAVVLETWREDQPAPSVYDALHSESPPDLIVVESASLRSSATAGLLLPLDEWVADAPDLLADLPPDVVDAFRVDGPLYAFPLGSRRGHAALGFAVTRSARDRGLESQARALLEGIRRRAPLRGLPDVAVTELRVLEPNPDVASEAGPMIEARVENLGDATAPANRLDLWLDASAPFVTLDVPALAPGADHVLVGALPQPTADRHVVHAAVDADGFMSELQKANNEAVESWVVVPFAGGTTPPPVHVTGGPSVLDPSAYQANAVGSGPKVAFDGTNYLVVWSKQKQLSMSAWQHELRAVRISPAGVVLDALPGIAVTSKAGHYPWFDVAYGGTTYLVVWEDAVYVDPGGDHNPSSGVYGRRVLPTGQLPDPAPFAIHTTASTSTGTGPKNTSAALCFDDNAFLVFSVMSGIGGPSSAAQASDGVWVRKVTPTAVVDPTRLKVVDGNSGHHVGGKVAAAFTGGRGYLAYSAASVIPLVGGGETVTDRFAACTALPPSPPGVAAIAYVLQNQVGKDVRFDGVAAATASNASFAFGWEKTSVVTSPITPFFYSGLLTHPPGTPSAPVFTLPSRFDKDIAIAFDGKNYLYAWQRAHGCHSYVGLMRRTPTGTFGDLFRFDSTQADLVSQVDVACGTTNALVAYANWRTSSSLGAAEGHSGIDFVLVDITP